MLIVICGSSFRCSANENSPTNTIPVVNITTEGLQPVVDKENYLNAKAYISVPRDSEFPELGNFNSPVEVEIRGRGNASWKVIKKSYKLKFAEKTEVLGLPKNRHYALLGCYGAAHEIGLFSYMTGLKVAELTGQPWVPKALPVELVLNGEYLGLYLLIETIRVDKNRLNIPKQPDLSEDLSVIDQGWLVEVDNYYEDNQILVPEYLEDRTGNLRVTHKTPEILSDVQRDWLYKEFSHITESTNLQTSERSDNWSTYIDAESMARYCIVREILHDTDGYNGSFYFHKGSSSRKWICGPMWDLGAIVPKTDWVMNDHPAFSAVHFIPYIFQTSAFQSAFIAEWNKFKMHIEELYTYIDSFKCYADADRANGVLWSRNGDVQNKINILKRYLSGNEAWIDGNIMNGKISEIFSVPDVIIEDKLLRFRSKVKRFVILSTSGVQVMRGHEVDELSLAELLPGLYILKVEYGYGKMVTMKIGVR